MTVQVKGFFHDAVSNNRYKPFEVPEGITAAGLLEIYYDSLPGTGRPEKADFLAMTIIVINSSVVREDTLLRDGDRVLLLREIGGG